MSTTLTPPPADPGSTPGVGSEPGRGNGRRTLARTVTIVGCALVAAFAVGATITAVRGGGGPARSDKVADVSEISAVSVATGAADVEVSFSPTATRAELRVESRSWTGVRDWTLKRDGDTLRVDDGGQWFSSIFTGGLFGGSLFGMNAGENAVLVLPADLEGTLDADLDVSAGSLTFTGDVDDVKLDVSAGDLVFSGAAATLDATVSAGKADVQTTDTRSIRSDVSAGRLTLVASGDAPTETSIDVSAGNADVTLPDVPYSLSGGESAGDRSIEVRQDPTASHRLHVSVSAGDAKVRAER